ncbi:DUF6663 family protein [Natronomonas sp. EA1]|uniref:DUF6663 family protein n=1 Tax=Natronomonas sp. EA1 TaxID=3421655 RepID=UPI003EBC12D2
MQQTTAGTYRVLASPRDPDEWLLLDTASVDPTYVPAGDEDLPELHPGNRVHAELVWDDDTPRFSELDIETETRFFFTRTGASMFEVALDCWYEAEAANEPMNAQVTYSTDNEPNGVVYTFADQPGQRDLLDEFRDGVNPLEPLVARAAENADPPFDVFVIDHTGHPFLVVYIVLDPDGILADTVRDTYF